MLLQACEIQPKHHIISHCKLLSDALWPRLGLLRALVRARPSQKHPNEDRPSARKQQVAHRMRRIPKHRERLCRHTRGTGPFEAAKPTLSAYRAESSAWRRSQLRKIWLHARLRTAGLVLAAVKSSLGLVNARSSLHARAPMESAFPKLPVARPPPEFQAFRLTTRQALLAHHSLLDTRTRIRVRFRFASCPC
jgi:hypothetical protein